MHSWDCDHYFYHSQGYAHVMFHMMQAIERENAGQLKDDPVLKTLFDDAIDALGKAAVMKPLIVLTARRTDCSRIIGATSTATSPRRARRCCRCAELERSPE